MVEQTNQKQQELTDADLEKIEENMKNMKNLEQQIKNEEGKSTEAAQTADAGKNGAAGPEDDSYEEGELQPGEAGAEIQDNPDERSVFVKNVDFSIGEEQLAEHFKECGPIERITIRKNPQTGQSIG